MSAQPTVVRPAQRKCSSIAYLFWALFGLWGVHQFYLGRRVRGVLYLLTLGLFGVGAAVDLFTIPRQVRRVNGRLGLS
jgi:TM2 domain-containing membrane protein YozV